MKNLFLLFTALCLTGTLWAQPPGGGGGRPGGAPGGYGQPTRTFDPSANAAKGNSSISGVLTDSLSGEGIPYAAIALFPINEPKPVDGAIADEKGVFTIAKIAAGTYRLQITSVGFGNRTIEKVEVAKNQDVNLGKVILASKITTLDEVEITSQKSLIEEKVDRLVYNADADFGSKGGDAADILRKVPLLSVDLDGNVQMRGSSNIRVLINNKPSTIVASSIADALKMIPADMIKTVEVITSPSAKYDGEGSGGIINIITKKTNMQGYNLNFDSGVGIRGSNLGLNGGFRQGKIGFTVGGHGRAFYNPSETTTLQSTLFNGITNNTNQFIKAFDTGVFGGFNLGMDYDLSKNTYLSANARYGVRNFGQTQDQTSTLTRNDSIISNSYRDVNSKNNSNNIDANVDFLKIFKPAQELSFSSQYSRNNLTNNYTADLLNAGGVTTSKEKNLNLNTNTEMTIQGDFTTPISTNQVFEVGAKGISRHVISDYTYLLAYTANGEYLNNPNRPSDVLDYTQTIGAAYSTYTYSTKSKFTVKGGLRYEYTSIQAMLNSTGAFDVPDYANLLPSLNLSQKISDKVTLKAAYNRRIQRPGLNQLNPNFNAANPLNISIGNPNLRPELTNNFELSVSGNLKKTYVNLSTFGRITNNAIQQVRVPSDTLVGGVITTFQNIGQEQAYGMNIFANVYITPKWTINGGGDLYYNYLTGFTTGANGLSQEISNSGLNISGRLMTQVTLNKGWGIQGFSFVRGSQVQLQGRQGGFYFYSLGFKKDFNERKGSFGLSADNFLMRGQLIRTDLVSETFSQSTENLRINRSVRLTFSYKFGKLNFVDSRKKTRSINNDDIKAGGDNSGGGGGGMPSTGGRQ